MRGGKCCEGDCRPEPPCPAQLDADEAGDVVVGSPAEIDTDDGADAIAGVATETDNGAVADTRTKTGCSAMIGSVDEIGADTVVAAAKAMEEGYGPAVVVMLTIQLMRLWGRKWWSGWEESYDARLSVSCSHCWRAFSCFIAGSYAIS